MKDPKLVLYPIHPAAVKRFREALYPSRTRDDPLDAALQLELLLHHRGRLRAWKPDTVETRKLQILVEQRRGLVDQPTAESNRLKPTLKLYYPQVLRWFDDVTWPLLAAFLKRWPTLQSAQSARPETLRKLFHRHNCRSEELIRQRIDEIGHAVNPAEAERLLDHLLVRNILLAHALFPADQSDRAAGAVVCFEPGSPFGATGHLDARVVRHG